MLVRVFYVSEIAEDITDIDVQVILGAAQINNRRLDVTGMLVQSDCHFIQLLEGREEALAVLMAKIERDRRHRNVRVLLHEPIGRRQFSAWAMHLRRRDDIQDETVRLHAEGCATKAEARRLIGVLLEREKR